MKRVRQYRMFCLQVIISWMLFSVVPLCAQKSLDMDTVLNSNASNEEKQLRISSLLQTFETEKPDSLHICFQQYAYWLFDIGEVKRAIEYENKALHYADSLKIQDIFFKQSSALNLGFYYRKNDQPIEAIKANNKAIEFDKENKNVIKAYTQIAHCYKSIHDYYKALEYYKLVLSLIGEKEVHADLRIRTLINMVNLFLSIKTKEAYQEGMKYADIADSITKQTKVSSRILYALKLSQASLFNQNETLDINTSLFYYTEALDIVKKQQDSAKIRDIYIGIGNLFNTTDPDRAINYQKKAITLTSKKNGFKLYQIYNNIGFSYAVKQEYQKAIEYMQKSLSYLVQNKVEEIENNYKSIYIAVRYKERLLKILPQLAETYLKFYEATGNKKMLDKSLDYFVQADYVIDLLRIDSRAYKSRLFWRKLSADIYGKAIRVCYLTGKKEMAFYFMEKNKSLILIEDIALQRYKRTLQVPKHLIKREYDLKMNHYQLKDYVENEEKISNQKRDSLKKVIIDQQYEINKLQDSLGLIYFEPEIFSLQQLQSDLKENNVLIEYHISEDDGYGIYTNKEKGYLLVATKEQVLFFEINNVSQLKKQVRDLMPYYQKPIFDTQGIKDYTKLSFDVFSKLFPENDVVHIVRNKKVTVVPDNFLTGIPFEALSTSLDSLSYLIQDTQMHYLYSYSFARNNQTPKSDKNTFLALAPIHFQENLTPLLNSSKEVLEISNYYRGRTLLEEQASKSNFLKELPSHNIIHLATHTNVEDPEAPFIVFRKEKLDLEELYLLKNKASLVVLSGCNTTLGKFEVGEGVYSLARGFFYSGAQSVLSTLWSIDDTSSSFITRVFYKNLSNGQTKSEALYNAKKEYLKAHSLSEASPHYWASFILLGADDVLTTSNSLAWILGGITSCVILIFLFFRYKK